MMSHVKLFYLGVLVLALSACALQPKSFDQSLALGYASQTTVLQTATGLLKRQQISKSDAERVMAISNHAGSALDAARDVKDRDVNSAKASLELATELLDQLTKYLANRGGV